MVGTTGVETPEHRYHSHEYFANVNGIAGMQTTDERPRNTVVLSKQSATRQQEPIEPESRQLQGLPTPEDREKVSVGSIKNNPRSREAAVNIAGETRKIVVDAFLTSNDSIHSHEFVPEPGTVAE